MNHDHSYKLLFSHAEMIADLLRGFVHDDWVRELDFDSLEKVNGSYISDDLQGREDDIVWRVRHKQQWLYIYLLIEFQSTIDHFMAVRILTYLGLLYQDLIRMKHTLPGRKLPPVLPIVLYNGHQRWNAAEDICDLIVPIPGDLQRYQPHLRYFLLDEGRFSDSELAPLRNLVGTLFRLENSRTPADVENLLAALVEWLKAPEQDSLRRAFTRWFKQVFLPTRMPDDQFDKLNDLQEVQNMLAERVIEWQKQWKQEGLQEGRQEGRQEGKKEGEAALLLRLMERRFGVIEDTVKQQIQSADAETLLLWGERIFAAQTPDDVVAQ